MAARCFKYCRNDYGTVILWMFIFHNVVLHEYIRVASVTNETNAFTGISGSYALTHEILVNVFSLG